MSADLVLDDIVVSYRQAGRGELRAVDGVSPVAWNMSSAAKAGVTRSASCTSAGPPPIWVNRSPQNSVAVVSS